ncbi:hypothetical protein CDAR_320991 [Caerostris darwini]|uniref:Uncharacterized protein n=1 Tax=Caerostris darwini TaxID=1538125 RepID=A0AAV4X0W5_9ARAC|nr:hypothetical protein CDAR_320991 [Caerostris darwini]
MRDEDISFDLRWFERQMKRLNLSPENWGFRSEEARDKNRSSFKRNVWFWNVEMSAVLGKALIDIFLDGVEVKGVKGLLLERMPYRTGEGNGILVYAINEEGIKPRIRKVKAITEFPQPKIAHEVVCFLHLDGFFKRFGQCILRKPYI